MIINRGGFGVVLGLGAMVGVVVLGLFVMVFRRMEHSVRRTMVGRLPRPCCAQSRNDWGRES
ncbi:MAG: hypothetical protein FJZ83_00130 [Chloroflexi bacterium]|nr:hypothetical protein [Chloroflexota bacterium]